MNPAADKGLPAGKAAPTSGGWRALADRLLSGSGSVKHARRVSAEQVAFRERVAKESAGIPWSGWDGINVAAEPVAIGAGFSASFSIVAGHLVVGWHPNPPLDRIGMWDAYTAARNAFLDRVKDETGVRIRVIDL